MAENAETEKEQERVNEEEALMKGDEDDFNEDQTLRKLRDIKIDQEFSKLKNQKALPVTGLLIKTPIPGMTADELWWREATKKMPPKGQKLVSLLRSLPSDSEDANFVYEILSIVLDYFYVRPLFAHEWGINQVLNPTTINRSSSDHTLQALMVAFVLSVSSFDNDESKLLVHACPGAMPFLIACLRSQTDDTRQFAATTLSWLSDEESNRKKMGESGIIGPLVELIRKGDTDSNVCLSRAARAVFNLCKEVENRERAISEGVVAAVMDTIRRRVCVDRMLRTLEFVSRDQKVISHLEENGMLMLKELVVMLGEEGYTKEDKEYCITIIHTACGGSVTKTRELISGAKNGRKMLLRVVSSGTAKAKEKANELLLKLDSATK